jgi:hypothetical protein
MVTWRLRNERRGVDIHRFDGILVVHGLPHNSGRLWRLRVVHVATGAYSVPPAGAGAVEKSIYFLTRALSEMGCDVDIVDIKSNAHLEEYEKVAYHEVWSPPIADRGLLHHIIRVSAFPAPAW